MPDNQLVIRARKIEITIDYSRCEPAISNASNPACAFACVKACRLYGRNILKIEQNRPVLAVTNLDEIERLDNECLACEYSCSRKGTGCVAIAVPLPGLTEYRDRLARGGV